MKLFPNIRSRRQQRSLLAFTLVEMLMSVWIYLFVLVGVMVAIQLFGLRVYSLAATKLTATTGGRQALNQIRDDIREGKLIQVGTLTTPGNPSSFSAYSGTNLAQGIALQIYFTTNQTAPYTIYYLDTSTPTNNLMEYAVTSAGTNSALLAGYITNAIVFDAEDFQNNVLSNSLKNNQIYGVTLQFSQWEYPIAFVGGLGLNAYDYYQLRTKVCRRALD
jgi:hypothetical protein